MNDPEKPPTEAGALAAWLRERGLDAFGHPEVFPRVLVPETFETIRGMKDIAFEWPADAPPPQEWISSGKYDIAATS